MKFKAIIAAVLTTFSLQAVAEPVLVMTSFGEIIVGQKHDGSGAGHGASLGGAVAGNSGALAGAAIGAAVSLIGAATKSEAEAIIELFKPSWLGLCIGRFVTIKKRNMPHIRHLAWYYLDEDGDEVTLKPIDPTNPESANDLQKIKENGCYDKYRSNVERFNKRNPEVVLNWKY